MEVPYFVTKAIDVWTRTTSLWRILSTYENKVIMDLAFLDPTALIIFYRYRDALRKYAKRHRKNGAEMKDDEKVKIVVLTLIHNLSAYTQSDILEIVLQWGNMLYEPKERTVPTKEEWQGIELLPIETQFAQTTALFNRYWYSSNDNVELYQSTFTEKKWSSFWKIIKKFQPDEETVLTRIIESRKISKPLVWLSIWWSIRKPQYREVDNIRIERPNWKLLKAFGGDEELIPIPPIVNNVKDTVEIFQGIRMTLADLGLRGKTRVEDAIAEGWKLDDSTKTELKNRIVEWLG